MGGDGGGGRSWSGFAFSTITELILNRSEAVFQDARGKASLEPLAAPGFFWPSLAPLEAPRDALAPGIPGPMQASPGSPWAFLSVPWLGFLDPGQSLGFPALPFGTPGNPRASLGFPSGPLAIPGLHVPPGNPWASPRNPWEPQGLPGLLCGAP